MTAETNLLGEYLRARRALVAPEDVGIATVGVRRVPGLRREEVALQAGISAEYYLRLEQGRDRNPSVQVVEAIANVLDVDAVHMLALAGHQARESHRHPEEAPPKNTAQLVHSLALPAFIENRYLDVVVANTMATAISPRWVVGGNRMRDLFTDTSEQQLYSDWRGAGRAVVAGFRHSVGTNLNDARAARLVYELSAKSTYFKEVWARHDVMPRAGATLTIEHPVTGPLRLHREKLAISESTALMLVIYHTDPGSESAHKLAVLASSINPPTTKD